MIYKLYQNDEFPVEYNTETGEKKCIGMCMQCPLWIEYRELLESQEEQFECEDAIENEIYEIERN